MDSQIPSIQPSPASRHPASQIPHFVQQLDPFSYSSVAGFNNGNYGVLYNPGTVDAQMNGGTSRMPKTYGELGSAGSEMPQTLQGGHANGMNGESRDRQDEAILTG